MISEIFQDWCLYDKNGAACCTKKLDLVEGWLDAGYIGESPFHNFINLFDKSVAEKKRCRLLEIGQKNAMDYSTIYNIPC